MDTRTLTLTTDEARVVEAALRTMRAGTMDATGRVQNTRDYALTTAALAKVQTTAADAGLVRLWDTIRACGKVATA